MKINEFIKKLKKLNLSLALEQGKLVLEGDENKLSVEDFKSIKEKTDIINFIKQHKKELIDYILLSKSNSFNKNSNTIESIYRLSGLQEGMLFHGLYDEQAGGYVEQFSCEITDVDLSIFRESWNQLLKNHSILRSSFHYDEFSIPVQCVHREVGVPIEILDYQELSEPEQGSAIRAYQAVDRRKGFDFKLAPLMRIGLIRISARKYKMIWTHHHMLSDGWSLPVMMKELLSTYEGLISSNPLPVIEEDRYEDYIRYIERRDKEKEEHYWRGYLKGLESSTLLPFITESTTQRNKGIGLYGEECLQIGPGITKEIEGYIQGHHITMNTLMQGVWAYLLHSYTGNTSITYGVTVSGRPDDLPRVEDRVGMYINTLPLHSVAEPGDRITDWLQKLQQGQLESREYQHTSFSDIQKWANVPGDLFDSLLVFENYPVSKVISSRKWSLQVDAIEVNEQVNYPLSISITADKEINISFSYNNHLLPAVDVRRIVGHFEHVLKQVISNKKEKLGDLELLTSGERKQLLEEFNDTYAEYPRDKTVVDLFEEQAARTPDAVAVVFEDQELSYRALNERSNQLGHYLRGKGVKSETLVPICIERSLEMIVGILGIMKAGGAYVPIDPDYPLERISYMLDDTGGSVVLTNEKVASILYSERGPEIICIDNECVYGQCLKNNLTATNPLNQVVCIIYTSGSTGISKGVKILNSGILNRIFWMRDVYPFKNHEKCVLKTSIGFVDHIWEVFGPLTNGIPSVLLKKCDIIDLDIFIGELVRHKITRLLLVPSILRSILNKLQSDYVNMEHLQLWTLSGEKLNNDLSDNFYTLFSSETKTLINIYGSTEITADATCYKVKGAISYQNIPIGKPISNTQVYITDSGGNLTPIGVGGEICIGGTGLARGYLNRPELTKEKFIENRYSDETGSRLYRTGDLGRWLPDGNIEFLGRLDDQVKIRGYRIELGEIESVLGQCELVSQSVVLAREDGQGNKRLVGYIVPEGVFEKEGIQLYLRERLPEYMVPSLFVELSALPLTSNGKIDRKSLPDPDVVGMLSEQYVAPGTETEKKLAEIWQELLGLDRVGIHDNFFELGGHSLLVTRVISAIRRQLNAELTVRDIFTHPTIFELSSQLQGGNPGEGIPSIEVYERRPERIPLSYGQERLWFIDQFGGSIQYHIPTVLRIKGVIDKESLSQAFQGIINRHEVLRTVIEEEDGHAYQQVLDPDSWELGLIEDLSYAEDPELLSDKIDSLTGAAFDLSGDHKLRADLIRINDQEHLLVITLHHIASDGWSVPILVKELVELYNSSVAGRTASLPVLPVQYADYSIWQRGYLQGEVLAKKLGYWQDRLQGVLPLDLPTDYVRPAVQSNRGARLGFKIDKELAAEIQGVCRSEGVTLFMTLLSAFKVLLYRYSGQEDICVGSAIANRGQHEVEDLVGFFVNTLALRSILSGDQTFRELLHRVREMAMGAYEHQDVPFEKVVDAVVKERDMSRSPLFQVLFGLQNNSVAEVSQKGLSGLEFIVEGSEHKTSQFDLTFSLTEGDDGLYGGIEYSTDLYKRETIARMAVHYEQLLRSVVSDPGVRIGDLELLTSGERKQLLEEFNDTYAEYPRDKTVVDLFEEQAARTPDAVAVVFEDQELSYRALNERSNQLGHYLRGKGVKSETLVPICIERSLEMIVGILGIMKAGGAYVPIDPDYPLERISYMLDDTGGSVMVSSGSLRSVIPSGVSMTLVELDTDWQEISMEPVKNVSSGLTSDNLAYVIYTSGSTGRPKGVMIEHTSLVNYLLNNRTPYLAHEINPGGSILNLSYTFDASITAMFMPLLSGKMLVLGGKSLTDIFEDVSFRKNSPYDFIKLTPAQIALLEAKLKDPTYDRLTKKLVIGGDVLKTSHIEYLYGIDIEIINEYGPTEATVGCSTYTFNTEDGAEKIKGLIPIGKPISNTQVYITDSGGNLTPIGVGGEICIGGTGLARGYLNRPELTKEKFIENRYSDETGSRLYRTGDLGRWLPDGNIEFLGRLDDQVKIRGYRIELGEIESVLGQCELVSQSVVLAREDGQGNKRLVGYIVPEGVFEKEGIQLYLRERLPEYMVPSLFVELSALPLTSNGKIDRKSLPDPDVVGMLSEQYVAPGTETEKKLAEIWQELLGLDRVGIHDNFFELGGHSLLAIRVISAIQKELAVEVSIGDIFDYPTISRILYQLSTRSVKEKSWFGNYGDSKKYTFETANVYNAMHQQRKEYIRFLIVGKFAFNSGFDLQFQNLDKEILKKTLLEIVQRHESLRTRYFQINGEMKQCVNEFPTDALQIDYVNLIKEENRDELLSDVHKRSWDAPFDFENGSPISFIMIDYLDGFSGLLVRIHHVISDDISKSILEKEIITLYESFKEGKGNPLQPPKIQFKDYALWVNDFLESEKGELARSFYIEKIKESITLNSAHGTSNDKLTGKQNSSETISYRDELEQELKHFLKRDNIDEFSSAFGILGRFYPQPGASYTIFIVEPFLIKLKELSLSLGTSLFMTVVSTLSILFYKINKEPGVRMYIPFTTRVFKEFEELVGWLTSEIIICVNIKDNFTFAELVNEASKNIFETSNHRFYPHERILADLDMPLNTVAPFFVNYLKVDKDLLSFNPVHDQSGSGHFHFKCTVNEYNNGIAINTNYNTGVYSGDRIENIFCDYLMILNKVMSTPEISMAAL